MHVQLFEKDYSTVMMFKFSILACFYAVILTLRMLTKTFLIIPFLIVVFTGVHLTLKAGKFIKMFMSGGFLEQFSVVLRIQDFYPGSQI